MPSRSTTFIPRPVPVPNFMGLVRYILALAVMIAHFDHLAGYNIYFPLSSADGVGGFFALSGFLTYGSYLRKPSLRHYLASRARRLLPPYIATILLFAILLSLLSTLSLAAYFTSSGFWAYLAANLTFLNFLHPTLPGVFTTLTDQAVNGSLWTMKVEWCLYLTPPLIVWLTRRLRARPLIIFILIYILAVLYRILFFHLYCTTGRELYHILSRQFLGQLSYFYVGVICYYCFETFMRHRLTLLLIALTALLLIDGHIILHPPRPRHPRHLDIHVHPPPHPPP